MAHDFDGVRLNAFTSDTVDHLITTVLNHSLSADTEHIAGLGRVCFDTLTLFGRTDEARAGAAAFAEKRPANFAPFRTGAGHGI